MTDVLTPMMSYEDVYGDQGDPGDRAPDSDWVRDEPGWVRDEPTWSSAHGAQQLLRDGDEPPLAELRRDQLRARLLTPDELAKLPPPEPLVAGLLFRSTLAALFGKEGTGKSFLAISLALATTTGSPWFGHEVAQGPVLYVAAEGTAGLAQRQRAWQDAEQTSDLGPMHWLPSTVCLLDDDWGRAMAALATELGAVLVIVDTVARSMVGGDENRSGDMAALVENADRVRRESGACVLLVHHTPKETVTLRGHSALAGAIDTGLLVESGDGRRLTLTVSKQKDAPRAEPMVFDLVPFGGSVVPMLPNGRGSNSDLVGAELTIRDAIGSLAGSDGLSSAQLLRITGLPERTFYRWLKNLQDRKITHNVGTAARPRWVLAGDPDD